MNEKSENFALRRRDVVPTILAGRGGMLVIGGLGSAAWDITAAGDTPLNFPLWGAMGGTVAIALGLAIAQPQRRILALSGDGDLLMGVGSLATVAVQAPGNLVIVALDNERYGETGMQETATASGVDLTGIARACGFRLAATVRDEGQLAAALPQIHGAAGPCFFTIKVRAETLPLVLPPKDGSELKLRFRRALLGEG